MLNIWLSAAAAAAGRGTLLEAGAAGLGPTALLQDSPLLLEYQLPLQSAAAGRGDLRLLFQVE
jgi:hypothetical protein